jgi:hypothetical protein
VVFGLMFAAIAAKPVANRNLMPYGIMLKAAYSGIVFYYWLAQGVPAMWKPFAVADVVLAALFLWVYLDPRCRRPAAA